VTVVGVDFGNKNPVSSPELWMEWSDTGSVGYSFDVAVVITSVVYCRAAVER